MPKSPGRARRGALSVLSCWGLLMALSSATAAPASRDAAPASRDSDTIPFVQRYQAVQHGGIVRTAASCVTCDTSSARLSLPAGSRVTYARLYWGGNLPVGERKPSRDNGRVLVAEPGGAHTEVLADTRTGHSTADGSATHQASADVTGLVRKSGPGRWSVARADVVRGGWSLVVAYENSREPLRYLSLWDGWQTLGPDRRSHDVRLRGLRIPLEAAGRAGVVGYGGDRAVLGDSLSVEAGGARRVWLGDRANPATDVMNSTISDLGRTTAGRPGARLNPPGYDSDVLDLAPALTRGGDHLDFRFHAVGGCYSLGVLFVQTDTFPAGPAPIPDRP
ncbi:DUF3344 domain-containing protein [Streptomyces sp. SYSU K21746]